MLGLGALLVAAALLEPVVRLDAEVRAAVQAHRAAPLDRAMKVFTALGRRDVVAGALLGVAVFDPIAGPATARFAIAALVGTTLVVEGLRISVGRPRPGGEAGRANASFPSGHAAGAFSLAWVLSRRWRRLAPGWWALAAMVAWSRVYLDRHYLSDVVCGALLGVVCTWGIARLGPFRAAPPRADSPACGAGPGPAAGSDWR